MCWSHSDFLLSSSMDKTVRLWDVESGAQRKFEGHTNYISSVAFSPDGKMVVSGSDTVRLWHLYAQTDDDDDNSCCVRVHLD